MKYPIKTLKVIHNTETGQFAISKETETGTHSMGKLNFDQVVAHLERYFVFKDDGAFVFYDKLWEKTCVDIEEDNQR